MQLRAFGLLTPAVIVVGCGDSSRQQATPRAAPRLTEDQAHELWISREGSQFERGRRRQRVAGAIANRELLRHGSPADARRLLGPEVNRQRTTDGVLLGYAVGVFLRSDKTGCTEVLAITFRARRDPVPKVTDICLRGMRPIEAY